MSTEPRFASRSGTTVHEEAGHRPTVPGWLFALYAAVVVYGTLFPIRGWRLPDDFGLHSAWLSWPARLSTTDVVTNLVIYLPVGALWVWSRRRGGGAGAVVSAAVVGTVLSYSLELVQIFLPRVSSRLDLVCNGLGSMAGGWLAVLVAPERRLGRRLGQLRQAWFARGATADVGLLAVGLWVLSQCAPLVPSANLGHLKTGVRPLWNTLRGDASVDGGQLLVYACAVLGVGVLVTTIARSQRQAMLGFSLLVPCLLAAKVPILTRQLSFEACAGSAVALGLLPVAVRWMPRRLTAASLVLATVVIDSLRPTVGGGETMAMNWVPLGRHNLNLFDFIDILAGLWPFVALAFLTRLIHRRRRSSTAAVTGGAAIAALLFAIEWLQRDLPGRTADITDVLFGVAAWGVAWKLMRRRSRSASRPLPDVEPDRVTAAR